MKKILKFLLLVLILFVIAILCTVFVIQFSLNGWVGVSIFFAIIGIWLGVVYIRKLLARRRMREFVSRVVDQEQSLVDINGIAKPNAVSALRKRWRESMRLVKKSKISAAIPWYLVMGGTNSGKTSAIKHAKLSTALSDNTKGISATESCEWWFLEKSIILDTTSRYIVPVDEFQDMALWREFVHLFVKYRSGKPLNGVVITISAESLLAGDIMSLRDEGQSLRKRIDNLMQACWSKFPVYLLITKMDQVFGFSETFLSLPEDQTNQAAGYLNTDNHDWQKVVDNFISEIHGKLAQLRTQVIGDCKDIPEPGMVILPQEFLALKAGLTEFVKAVFENNPYQEAPIFRGIYLSSARQDSQPKSAILSYDGEYIKGHAKDRGWRGLFLRDFFGTVLPVDDDLVVPAYSSLKWRSIASSIGVLSILCIFIAAACLYTASYIHNRNILNQFLNNFKAPPTLTGDITQNLITLNDFEQRINQLDNADRSWFLPSLGMTTSSHWVRQLKNKYVHLYEEGVLKDFNKTFENNIEQIGISSNSYEVSLELDFMLTRIKSIEYYLNGGELNANDASSNANLSRAFSDVMNLMYQQMPTNVGEMSANTYNAYLAWNGDKKALNNDLMSMLKAVHEIIIEYPNWKATEDQTTFKNLGLSDFWGQSTEETALQNSLPEIPGIFTKNGMEQLEHYFKIMEKVGITTGDKDPVVQKFWSSYQIQYYTAWQNFAQKFSQGADLFPTDSEKRFLAARMLTDDNPYEKFLKTAGDELSPREHLNNPPDWVRLLLELNDLQNLAKYKISQAGFEQKVLRVIRKIIPTKAVAAKSKSFDLKMQAIDLLVGYNSAMMQTNLDLISDDSYLRFMEEIFSEYNGTAEQKSSVSSALLKFNQLQQLLDKGNDDSSFIWRLEAGPLDYVLKYIAGKATCAIESKWQGNVLGAISEVPNDKVNKQLLDKTSGLLWKFVNDVLAPFLNLGEFGYSPKAVYRKTPFAQKIEFSPEFIDFLNRAQPSLTNTQAQYSVNLGTVPVTVNDEADIEPYEVILTIQCADGEQTLKNYNHLNEMNINWSPDKCGDTTLSIVFPNLTLTKTYVGSMAFPQFLSDFRTGSHRFDSDEFQEKDTLKENNVDWINVKYTIDQGGVQVMNLLRSLNANIPQSATDCRSLNAG